MAEDQWRLGRRPALDGIRAVAAGAVVLDHAGVWGFDGGGLGVDVFFALSGFLITSLLVEELADTGRIRLRVFWVRRALRLLPAVFALVAVVLLLLPALPADTPQGVWPTLLYWTNWHRALIGDVGALGHTWSLAIEEQFYLAWPLLLPLLIRVGGVHLALRFSLAGVVAVAVLREAVTQTGAVPFDHVYNGFQFRADAILIGCALALALHAGTLPRWVPGGRMATVGLVAFGVAFFGREVWGAPLASERLLAGAVTCCLVAALCAGTVPRLERLLSRPTMRWLGVRSYALYLWHYPIARMLLDDGGSTVEVVAVIAFSVAAAAVSYRYVETPFLRLKDRVGRPAWRTSGVEILHENEARVRRVGVVGDGA